MHTFRTGESIFAGPGRLACGLISLIVSGCVETRASDDGGLVVRDSVGTVIQEHAGLPELPPTEFLVGAPTVVIGSTSGDGPDVFGRIVSVAERADGAVLVADGLAREVRAFDRDGNHLWTAGGHGQGPGEFGSLAIVNVVRGDSAFVVGSGRDSGGFDRVVVLGPDGNLARSFQLDPAPFQLLGILQDGELVGFRTTLPSSPVGRYRGSHALVYYDREGKPTTEVADFATGDYVRIVNPDGSWIGFVPRGARRTEAYVGRQNVIVTTQDRLEVHRFAGGGGAHTILRVLEGPVVPDAVAKAAREEGGEFVPDSLPAVGRLRLDELDRYWVEEPLLQFRAESNAVWWIFGSDGTMLGQALVPAPLTVHHVWSDHLVGVFLDSLDVPFVQVRPITIR